MATYRLPMGFAGNLRTLSLPEVVQTLARIQATGVLRLARSDGKCDVMFEQGQIIGVASRAGSERQALLNRMIIDGKLDANAAAALSASGSESQVVQVLIDQKLVNDEDVHEARQRQAEEELHDLCTWDAADFVFIDAAPEEPDAMQLVQKYGTLGLTFNTGSLLMEAARRMDEWNRIREKLPHGTYVMGVADGMEEKLTEAGTDYPALAVVPLIDAIRTIDDIVKDAMAPRLEVYQVLEDLLEQGLICALNRDDIIAHADYWQEQQNHELAARLFRRALAYDSKDKDTFAKLGACLEHLGEGQEAAACFGQMAIGLLDDGEHQRATEYAAHAVSLMPRETTLRLTLARCNLMTGDEVSAVGELREVAKIYLDDGQLEDARGTCLKILDISRQDEFARRELARIFSRVEHDHQSEDVVVCVQCGVVNHREATTCTGCKASLQLSCLACGRVVAVSDPLCIFCGADPHAGGGHRRAGGSPTTSRIIRRGDQRRAPAPVIAAAVAEGNEAGTSSPSEVLRSGDKGTAYWRDQLDRNLKIARAHEEAGHLEEALTAWREVSKVQLDNADLLVHIRELESRVNQESIERNIERGHSFRRTRHYWKALRAYRDALRAMSSDDPRLVPVQEVLARTEQDQRRIAIIYGAAGAVLLVLGVIAARPYVQSYSFGKQALIAQGRIDELTTAVPESAGDQIRTLDDTMETLAGDADRIRGVMGTTAKSRIGELRASLYAVRLRLSGVLLDHLEKAIGEGRAVEAEQLSTTYTRDFGGDLQPDRFNRAKIALAALKRQLRVREDESKAAPLRLEAAKAFEKDGRLADAVTAYRELTTSANPEVASESVAGLKRQEKTELAQVELWKRVVAMPTTDLQAAREALASEEVVRMAQAWNHEGDRLRLLRETEARLQSATQAFTVLGSEPTSVQIQAFLAAHGAAPEAARARTMLSQAQSRTEAKDRAMEAYKAHMEARHWAEAWQTGRDLVAAHGRLLSPGQVLLPQVVESSPAGATVTWKGREVGRTPLVLTYVPGDDGDITLSLAGWKPLTAKMSAVAEDWRWAAMLIRSEAWRTDLGGAVDTLATLPDGRFLAQAGDGLAALDGRGTILWRHALGSDDLSGGRIRLAHSPAILPDGRGLIGLPGHDAVILDVQGNPTQRFQTNAEVRGRPLVYTNDAYGAQPRIAMAAESLWTGPVGGELSRIPLPAAALAGPVAIDRRLDAVLVMVLVDGRLIGIEESTKAQAWPALGLQASDVGQLITAGPGQVAVVLDGGRLALIRLTGEGATLAWTQVLKGSAVGDPVVNGATLAVSAGRVVHRFGINGSALAAVPLASPASSAPALDGDLGAVGCQDGTLVVWKGERILWTTPCGAPVTSVTLLPKLVVAGLGDGRILAYAR